MRALLILHEVARQTHALAGSRTLPRRTSTRQPKTRNTGRARAQNKAWPARKLLVSCGRDDAGHNALGQSDQLRQLGSQLLQVLVAPLEPIVFSSFNKSPRKVRSISAAAQVAERLGRQKAEGREQHVEQSRRLQLVEERVRRAPRFQPLTGEHKKSAGTDIGAGSDLPQG